MPGTFVTVDQETLLCLSSPGQEPHEAGTEKVTSEGNSWEAIPPSQEGAHLESHRTVPGSQGGGCEGNNSFWLFKKFLVIN